MAAGGGYVRGMNTSPASLLPPEYALGAVVFLLLVGAAVVARGFLRWCVAPGGIDDPPTGDPALAARLAAKRERQAAARTE